MLKLKNVSKFYYSNGIVTSGFTKVNLELNKGEFVAITGESGSGKSTLLNVISGLDTYEEGEMYINGEETSAYSSADFEVYRRRYIANIYQAFNLINSYTVFQNVEMVLLLNGVKRREARKRVMEVLKQVDLYSFRNAKASKLSGGQKQRVAIARALVKDTPIIVADEPTGNLDSQSAANVIELLSRLAADRLVVVVTHNYEQVEPYVTRKITMHDGRIAEDLVIREPEQKEDSENTDAPSETKERKKHLKGIQRVRLGLRNTFNIIPKFLLLLFIFFFLCAAVTGFYANMRAQDYGMDGSGYNYYFNETSDKRIIIKKADGTSFTEEDYADLEALTGVDYVYRDDVMLDNTVYLNDEEYWYYIDGNLKSLDRFEGTVDYGRMPDKPGEVLVDIPSWSWLLESENAVDEILSRDFYLGSSNGAGLASTTVRVVGISVIETEQYMQNVYVAEDMIEGMNYQINAFYSTMKVRAADQELEIYQWSMENKPVPSDLVERGCAIVPEEWNWMFPKGKAKGQTFDILVSNLYYEDTGTFKITDTYNKKTFTKKTGYSDYDYNNGLLLVNSDDYAAFFDKGTFQSSVFLKDADEHDQVLEQLKDMGYVTLYIRDSLKNYGGAWREVDKLWNNLTSGVLVVVLFFICYFIIKLIMRSRNVYYATVRMLGGSAGDCRALIVTELMAVMHLAFGFMMAALWAAREGHYSWEFTDDILRYLTGKDYVVLYAVLLVMSVLIALRYSRQLFKSSAMNVYKEA